MISSNPVLKSNARNALSTFPEYIHENEEKTAEAKKTREEKASESRCIPGDVLMLSIKLLSSGVRVPQGGITPAGVDGRGDDACK
mgnify:CR=1 FL=1